MSDFEKFKEAIFGQESGNGAVDTSQPNYAGARGKGQITLPTFQGLQKAGKIPATYDWANPAHNEAGAVAYMQEAWDASGAKPDLAAAYYYGGPKAVKGGQIVTYRDLKNPKAPTTNEYAASILKRMGAEPSGPSPLDHARAVQQAVQQSIVRPGDNSRLQRAITAEDFDDRIQEEARPDTLEQFGAALMGNTTARLARGITDRIWGPEFPPEDGFKPDLKNLPKGSDGDLIEAYAGAKSAAQAQHILGRYEQEQDRIKTVMDNGIAKGMLLSLAAEIDDPTNILVPFMAARGLAAAGRGSLVLAQQGQRGASLGSSVGENLISGTALEGAAQLSEGKFRGDDLLVSLVADSLLGVGTGLYGLRAVGQAERLVAKGIDESVTREAMLAARASAELPAGVSTGELRQVMERLEAEDATAFVKAAASEVPDSSKLLRPDTELQQDLKAASPYADADTQAFAAEVSARDARFNNLQKLGLGLDDVDREGSIAALKADPGIHYADSATNSGFFTKFKQYGDALESLRQQFIPDVSIHITDGSKGMTGGNLGTHGLVKPGVSMIALRADSGMATAIHEFGHAVFAHRLAQLPDSQKAELEAAWQKWQQSYMTPGKAQDAALERSPVGAGQKLRPDGGVPYHATAAKGGFKEALADVWDRAFPGDQAAADKYARYYGNFDEFSAEQFAKFVEAEVAGVGTGKLTVPQQILQVLGYLIQQAAELFKVAKAKNLVKADASFEKFFVDLLEGNQAKGLASLDESLQMMAVPAKPADVVNEVMTDPDAVRFGLATVPVGTPAERKQAQAMLALHKQAEAWAAKNPMDAAYLKRVDNLADNNVFNVASTGLLMLKSESPLVRMIASELLEDASGAAGKRQPTAAISKHLMERFMMGNAINDVQRAYGFWKNGKPGGLQDDLIGGKRWEQFNKEVAAEIEARSRADGPVTQDANIKAAADSLEASYQRIANAQRKANTLGSEGLPTSSKGYMPHRMSAKAVINLTNEQQQVVHSALTDQFVTIEGWDASFSDALASQYLKRVRDRAAGDYGSPIGGGTASTASLVEEALRGMDLPEVTVAKHMAAFSKGAANFTKGRINLDLNKVYPTSTGEFRLLDIFETNQIELLRSQAGRASGEVALTNYGVRGKPGLKLLRDSMQYGADGAKASMRDKESFDQIAAEFLNEPFGTHGGKFMERAMAANTLVRMGGMVFNQISESINAIFHVGAVRAASSVLSIPRLTKEIKDLVDGKAGDNPFLTSIEHAGGAEFGTDAYKYVMPFDSPDHAYPTYGQDTLTLTDRLLRGGGHLQAKLSGWRLIHSSQQRGMAEQIVQKMLRYVNEGKDDTALRDFGITPEVQAALKADLSKVTAFDSAGRPQGFDVTKMTDPAMKEAVIQAVWRGTSQIIQGTYIGERGKWAHDGWLKLLTQFRSFSLTSMEKQWGRQRNNHGSFAAFGMMMGSMSIAAPIYMARVYANSVGRPDQAEYLEQRLTPEAIARATLNYIAMSGMAGDFVDMTTSLLPDELGVKPTGGRAGIESDFVGTHVLPASSLVNDIWHYAQSPLNAADAAKIMPMSRLPFVVPLANGLRE